MEYKKKIFNEEDNEYKPTVNNYYINTDKKQSQQKKQKIYKQSKNDLDLFVENNLNMSEFFAEEQIEDFDNFTNEYENFNENKGIFILKTTRYLTSITIFILLITMLIYNLISFNILNRDITSNTNELQKNELLLESESKKLDETSDQELIEVFIHNGYNKIDDINIKKFTPNQKKSHQSYTTKSNFFNEFCNRFYLLFFLWKETNQRNFRDTWHKF